MAREFILFVHICHWIGRKTAVPFKMSSGLLTICHRSKMKTSGEWGAATAPGKAAQIYPALLTFLPDHKLSSALDSTFQEEPPNMNPCLLRILSTSVGFCAYPAWVCLPTWKGSRERKGQRGQPQSHQFVNYNGPGKDSENTTFYSSIKACPIW